MLMEDMTSREFAQGLKKTRTAILPIGSVEEHGGHLPLKTDTMHIEALARAAAEQVDVFVAPAVPYGLCRSTAQHPGTVSISFDTVRALVRDIGRSLYHQGIRRLIVATGHAGGSHQTALLEAGEDLNLACPDLVVAVLSVVDLLRPNIGGLVATPNDAHAGELETSIVMHLAPELVKGTSPREYPAFPAPVLVRHKAAYWPGGVWGDPGAATEKKGRELVARGVAALIEIIAKVNEFEEKN